VSDIFREVDEEVRREQFRQLWRRYGGLIIGACIALVVAVGGWRAYEWRQSQLAAQAGAQFETAVALFNEGKHKEAEDAFAKVAAEGTPSYRMLASFRKAAEVARHDPKAAVAIYDQLAADTGIAAVMRDLAAVRGGAILVDSAPLDEIVRRLEPTAGANRAFRHSARATLALAAWRAQDNTALRRWSEMILTDPDAPQNARNQVQVLLALSDPDKKG
jgi:hypothetical protein